MLVARPALGGDEIVRAVYLENVRPFDPNRLLRDIDTAVHDDRPRADQLLRLGIELLDPDRAMAVVPRLLDRWPVVRDVRLPVSVEEDRGIDSVHLVKPDRV